MYGNGLHPTPRAVVATCHAEARDFLSVHLADRGLAVECVHRAEYLRVVAPGAAILIVDASLLREADLPAWDRPRSLLVLSSQPSAAEALAATGMGARRYLAVPFSDPAGLASTLDTLVAECTALRMAPNAELALQR